MIHESQKTRKTYCTFQIISFSPSTPSTHRLIQYKYLRRNILQKVQTWVFDRLLNPPLWFWHLGSNSNVLDPFVASAPFLYPLKTLENRTGIWCYQGVKKGCIGHEWVKKESLCIFRLTDLNYTRKCILMNMMIPMNDQWNI